MEGLIKRKHLLLPKGETNIVLVILLVIASFLIGSLWTRTQFMDKEKTTATNGKVAGTETSNTTPSANQPEFNPAQKTPKIVDTDHIKGDKNAPIAMIEYSDIECPYCKKFQPTAQQVLDEYKGKVMWVYRHYLVHPTAQKSTEASECAAELGGNDVFWKYLDSLYAQTEESLTSDKLAALAAKEVGLDEAKFKECVDSGKYSQKIQDQMKLGQEEGISGTPGTIILNVKTGKNLLVPGAYPFEEVKKAIDSLM